MYSYRDFEAEVSYIPAIDHNTILSTKDKCYSRCTKCTNYNSPLETQGVINEKGASVMATYSNVESEYSEQRYKTWTGGIPMHRGEQGMFPCTETCTNYPYIYVS